MPLASGQFFLALRAPNQRLPTESPARVLVPLSEPPTGLRLMRYGNVLATARQIGKDGAEADSNGVRAGKFPKIAAFSVNSGVIHGETAHGCSGSEKIEVWRGPGRQLCEAG